MKINFYNIVYDTCHMKNSIVLYCIIQKSNVSNIFIFEYFSTTCIFPSIDF